MVRIAMGFFKLFKSTSYETIENKGDTLFDSAEFGPAKQAYEKALLKLESSDIPEAAQHFERIKDKINQTREALARQHKATAEDLIEAGLHDDALELLELARELSSDSDLAAEIEHLLTHNTSKNSFPVHEIIQGDMPYTNEQVEESDDAYFSVLCSTLPEDLETAYENYGHSFQMGYVALNQGSFDIAAEFLSKAMVEHPETVTHIHLELATAYLNLGDSEKSHSLLEQYLAKYPSVVRTYEMLCEIYWEQNAFKRAEELISNCPDDIKTSIPMMLLMGETLFKAGNYAEAESFYQNSIRYTGWNESVATALARTFEALGSPEKALKSYGEIMNACKGCRQQVNPFVKQRYAELSYESGDISSSIVELYFSLCNEDPQNRSHYFRRLSEIYSRQGYHEEAQRYLAFAEADDSESIYG
jgi:tetratricopeptide (TPR) repeat protein